MARRVATVAVESSETLLGEVGRGPYAVIRKALLAGEFAPDDVLLETRLASQLSVSRTPIREALGRLASEGLLERLARGFRVRRSSPEELLGLYEARIFLESELAGLAAERHTPLDEAMLKDIERRAAETSDAEELHVLSSEWHNTVRAAGHNAAMSEFLATIDTRVRLYNVHHQTNEHEIASTNIYEHSEITHFVLARDPDATRAHMREHLGRIRDLRVAVLLRRHAGASS